MSNKVDLSTFNNECYKTGGSLFKRCLWFILNKLVIRSYILPSSSFKIFFLRLFGATIGKSVVIRPGVNIKFPWRLTIGDNSWIGENVWIDNLESVQIGSNVCISQGALILSGNHDYKSTSFDLLIAPIVLEEGVWIGAKAIVCQAVTIKSHAVLTTGSIATSDLEPYSVCKGNPAKKYRERIIK